MTPTERDLKKIYYMSPTEGSKAMRVVSIGEPGPGGAHHEYRIDIGEWIDIAAGEPGSLGVDDQTFEVTHSFPIKFQVGPFGGSSQYPRSPS